MMTVDEYFLLLEKRLDTAGRFSTSRNYRRAQKSFSLFREGESLPIAEMSDEIVTAYNRYLENRGVVRNTRSFYNRILRSVYNKAVSEGYAPENVRLFEILQDTHALVALRDVEPAHKFMSFHCVSYSFAFLISK